MTLIHRIASWFGATPVRAEAEPYNPEGVHPDGMDAFLDSLVEDGFYQRCTKAHPPCYFPTGDTCSVCAELSQSNP